MPKTIAQVRLALHLWAKICMGNARARDLIATLGLNIGSFILNFRRRRHQIPAYKQYGKMKLRSSRNIVKTRVSQYYKYLDLHTSDAAMTTTCIRIGYYTFYSFQKYPTIAGTTSIWHQQSRNSGFCPVMTRGLMASNRAKSKSHRSARPRSSSS